MRLTLRRLVGAEVVIHDGEALALAPSVRVDRDDFLGHLTAKRLHEAIRLYRGPFCDRFAAAGAEDFERWVGAERTSLQSHAVEAIDHLATVALNEARVSDALALATRLREADGDDERHWRIRLEALFDLPIVTFDDFAKPPFSRFRWAVRQSGTRVPSTIASISPSVQQSGGA